MEFQLKGNYFNGNFFHKLENADETIQKFSPANLDHHLWTASITYGDLDNVVNSSVKGFKKWKSISQIERINFLKKYQEKVLIKKEILARAISLETGKPYWEAISEVNSVISKLNITIEYSLERIKTKIFNEIAPQTNAILTFKPIGPILIIGPFNFPCHLAGGQILSALISGNSIIFKPSEKTLYSGQILIECFHEAEFPDGVINFVNGGGETVTRLLKYKEVKGIHFTGSKDVGLKILSNTYQCLSKLVALELGGKNISIVHEDASFNHALYELLQSSFLTTGQRCTSTSIILIHDTLKDRFIDEFHQLAKKIIIDHPIDYAEEPFMGPLIDDKALNNYLLFMGMAKREGATEIMRGKPITKKYKGYYVSPSIHYMEKFNPKSIFLGSEVFGPNCTFLSYKNIEEIIPIFNSNEYGLASSIFTKNKSIQNFCMENIECGQVNINRSTIGASPKLPFGGVKSSGNYRPAALTMIDSCVYSQASLELLSETSFDSLKGISKN